MTDLPPLAGTRHGLPVVDLNRATPPRTPLLRMMELARRHGPAFYQRRGDQEGLFVSGLDLVTELADEQRFTKNVGIALKFVREFAGDGLFTAYNEEPTWAKAHDVLAQAFALSSMRTYHPAMLRVAQRLLAVWDRRAAAGEPVEVAEDTTRLTLDTIGLAGFGFDFESFTRDEPHPFVAAMVRCLNWAMSRTAGAETDDEAFRANTQLLNSVVDEVIAARRTGARPELDDLLGLMLEAEHPDDGTPLDTANIRNQVITFLIAGHETTSGTMAFALHHLAKNPAVLRAVQREVDELWGDEADPEPSFEDVGRLRLVRQVLDETLRLWPTAPGFGREAREDTTLGGIVPLRPGEPVGVITPVLHRDPAWGDNPELFDPSRFAPEAEAARSPHAFKPFGTGERACIGRQFALHEATMALAMIVHRYRLIDHAHYQLQLQQSLTIKPAGLTLRLVPRTSADRARRAPSRAPSAPAHDSLPARVHEGTSLLLLHGTNYGTCREFSQQLADIAGDLGCSTDVDALDPHAGALPTDRPVIITAASYNGQPTDDAAKFAQWLEEAPPGAAEGVTYAVLGVGDRNWWGTYQHVPTFLDRRLAELGGQRLIPRGEADASRDLAGAVSAFAEQLRTALLERSGDPASTGAPREPHGYAVTEITGGPLDALAARHELTEMTVTETRSLTDPAYSRVKRFVRVALPPGTTYRTADHLAVLPANDPDLVERAAKVVGADPDAVLSITPTRARRDVLAVDRPLTVRELFTRHVELQDRPTGQQLTALAGLNPCPPERKSLQALAERPDERTLLDVLEDHPALRESLTWPALLDLLPQIRPRHYSISSSPTVDDQHADLMVSLLEAPARSGRGAFRGTASRFLNSVRPGDTVLARVRPCRETFRIDHDVPLVMIAAGTGLAPFRAAIADRLDLAADLPPALCYFGCDAPDADFLHADELRAAERSGAVSLRPVFSEASVDGHRFVQDRIAAESDEIWHLLESGAKVHVCGDGRRMAPGVREAFRHLHDQHRTGDADAWLRNLISEGRYVEDVYAG
jgi:cytochrome P450/NADPH-cytochrome P450 reductase